MSQGNDEKQMRIEQMSDFLIDDERYFNLTDPSAFLDWGYANMHDFYDAYTDEGTWVEDFDITGLFNRWYTTARITVHPEIFWTDEIVRPEGTVSRSEFSGHGIYARVHQVTNPANKDHGRWRSIFMDRGLACPITGRWTFGSVEEAKAEAESEAVKYVDRLVVQAVRTINLFTRDA